MSTWKVYLDELALLLACNKADLAMVEWLLIHGADVDVLMSVPWTMHILLVDIFLR